MKTSYIPLFLMLISVAARAGGPNDVPPGGQRIATVKFAKDIVALETAPPMDSNDVATLKNPFNPAAPPAPSEAASPGGSMVEPAQPSERDQLAQIAPNVTPSGSVEMGGESLLLFGQKRLKVGDHLSIIFEGKPYELELVGIQSTSFTLRLNGVEITRPIKSVTKP